MISIEKITFACNSPDRLAAFWERALEFERLDLPPEQAGGEPKDPDHVVLTDPGDRSPGLLFKRMPKSAPEDIPIHLDLAVPDREAAVDRLESLGASAVETKRERAGDHTAEWTVMEDPEGNGFCVCERESE